MNSRYPLEYTAEQAAARKHDHVCLPCGRQFLREDQLDRAGVVTMHGGECCMCGQRTGVTHVRAYNWLRVLPTGPPMEGMSSMNADNAR